MDGFFGIGFWEVLLILVVILALLGPRKLPEIAARLGDFYRRLRGASRDLTAELSREIEGRPRTTQEGPLDSLKKAASELKSSLSKESGETQSQSQSGSQARHEAQDGEATGQPGDRV